MKHKLESRLLGEISITSDSRWHHPYGRKWRGTKKPLAAAAAKSLQSCPTLCDPRYGSPPGSPIPGILQARTLEWVAISFSNAWKWKVKVKSLSRVQLLATPWTAAYQVPPSMGFSRKEYWSGVPLFSPKSLLKKVKEEGEKVGLKLNIQKTNIMASSSSFHGK